MPRLGGGGSSGDLKVKVKIDVPRHLTPRQKELLLMLAEEEGETVGEKGNFFDRVKDALGGK